MQTEQIKTLLQKQDEENITQKELGELRKALIGEGFTEFDEFKTAKLAFTQGHTDVFVNEFGPQTPLALPDKWVIDSGAVSEFGAWEFIKVTSDDGDFYYLTPAQLSEFENPIRATENQSVNDLLVEAAVNSIGRLTNGVERTSTLD